MTKESVPKHSLQEIFDSMDYGSISESKSLAQVWLKENGDNLGSFINGKFANADESEKSEVVSTGVSSPIYIAQGTQQEFNSALSASSSSFSKWSTISGHARASVIYSIARQIQKHTSLFCEIEACSRFVQIGNAREVDIPALVRIFYYYAGWAQLSESDLTEWRPVGPVLGVTSNSAPITSLAMLIAPALAAGNTITLLPDVSNCLSALLLAQICTASGVPPGVINVVPQSHSLLDKYFTFNDKIVKKVAVIGSPSLARNFLRGSDLLRQNHIMLLNGCIPMIVMDCADLDAAVDCAIDATCQNQGQDPWALRLIVVQESVYTSFKAKLVARVTSLKTGPTFEKMADVSDTVADKSLALRLQEILISDPSSEVFQPSGSSQDKWSPTFIFSAAPPSEPVLQSSNICPVVYVVGARSAKEATSIANHCGGGVAASVWTETSAVAWESSLQLKVSTVWINSFGILDASVPICGRNSTGSGCFLGKEGLLEYMQPVNSPVVLPLQVTSSNSTKLLPVASDEPGIDHTYKLFYGGGHKRPSSSTYRTLCDGNGRPIAVVPEANRKDVRNAVEAAVKVQSSWWKRGPFNRAQIIFNLAEKLKARQDHFARCLQALYQNIDHSRCLQEVEESVELLFHFGAICDKSIQSTSQSVGDTTIVVQRDPLGIVAIAYGAGNHTAFAGLLALVGAAIAYGNTCVVMTDLDWAVPTLELALLVEAAEVPPGVVNILTGVISALLPTVSGHMDINAVWCAGLGQKCYAAVQEECSKSNLKEIWMMEEVLRPRNLRETFERRASQSKAIWVSGLASFGS